MARKQAEVRAAVRQRYTDEFKREAVQMLLDGHSASSVTQRLGLSGSQLLYRWKREQMEQSGPVATSLEARVRELESELHRVERERDILKKALAIFGRSE
jgi:transposase